MCWYFTEVVKETITLLRQDVHLDGGGGGGVAICFTKSSNLEINVLANGGASPVIEGLRGGNGGNGAAIKASVVGGDALIIK